MSRTAASSRSPGSKTEPPTGAACASRAASATISSTPRTACPPLIRENGELRKASWDEALDLVAEKFRTIIAESGPDAVAGVSCARSINEDSYNMQKLFRAVFKTNNIDHCART